MGGMVPPPHARSYFHAIVTKVNIGSILIRLINYNLLNSMHYRVRSYTCSYRKVEFCFLHRLMHANLLRVYWTSNGLSLMSQNQAGYHDNNCSAAYDKKYNNANNSTH